MKKYFFVAILALLMCSCGNKVEIEESNFSVAVEEQNQESQVYKAKVLRVQQIIETRGYSSSSRTVLLLDEGSVFSVMDEYHEDQALLRVGDEVEYTKKRNGKIEKIVRCIYQQAKVSE